MLTARGSCRPFLEGRVAPGCSSMPLLASDGRSRGQEKATSSIIATVARLDRQRLHLLDLWSDPRPRDAELERDFESPTRSRAGDIPRPGYFRVISRCLQAKECG